MPITIQNKLNLDLTPGGGGTTQKTHVFDTYAEMLGSQPPLMKGDKAIVIKDPDPTRNGRYNALVDNASKPKDFLKQKEPFEILPWRATTQYYERGLVVDTSTDDLYYVTKDFKSATDIKNDISLGNLKQVGSEGLRGKPVKDEGELASLPARDFELRAVNSTSKQYVFMLGATSGDIRDQNHTGFWNEVKQSTGSVITFNDESSTGLEDAKPGMIGVVLKDPSDHMFIIEFLTDTGLTKGVTVADYIKNQQEGVDYVIPKINPSHINIPISNVFNLQKELDSKAPLNHKHTKYQEVDDIGNLHPFIAGSNLVNKLMEMKIELDKVSQASGSATQIHAVGSVDVSYDGQFTIIDMQNGFTLDPVHGIGVDIKDGNEYYIKMKLKQGSQPIPDDVTWTWVSDDNANIRMFTNAAKSRAVSNHLVVEWIKGGMNIRVKYTKDPTENFWSVTDVNLPSTATVTAKAILSDGSVKMDQTYIAVDDYDVATIKTIREFRSTVVSNVADWGNPTKSECITAFKLLPHFDFSLDDAFYIKDTNRDNMILVKYFADGAIDEASAGSFWVEKLTKVR